jgi:hemin uptake protein HemP
MDPMPDALLPRSAPKEPPTELDAEPRIVQREALMGGASKVGILHNGRIYWLRRTRLDGLILTR